jgi:hypothetical protein
VTHNRFIGFTNEQCTAAGQAVQGGAPEDIVAGADGVCETHGSVLISTGAAIALGSGGGTFEWVQTDANGRVITYAGGAANVAGFITVAAGAANELAEVHLRPLAAPLI